MIIGILSHVGLGNGGSNILFPLLKWKNEIIDELGVEFKIYTNHEDKRLYNHPIVIILHRYFHVIYKNSVINDKSWIVSYIRRFRERGQKVIFFDTGDSTGSRDFDLLPFVDSFWKKQILTDKNRYTENNGDKSVRCWINDYSHESKKYYVPAKKDQLTKILIAWNIGMVDYRNIPQIGRLGFITNRLIWPVKNTTPTLERIYDTQFRGTIGKENAYNFQRGKVISILEELQIKGLKILIGDKVIRNQFLRELKKSRIAISPYGWGEICYRDFESFMAGCVLVKPDMSHLITFPNYFIPKVTYMPVRWDMGDLENLISDIAETYENYIDIATEAQKIFMETQSNPKKFIQQLKKLLMV